MDRSALSRRIASAVRLCLCLALCAAIGWIGGRVTAAAIPTWYAGLAKPSWTPPNFVFPITWSILYLLIAIALWRLWDRAAPSRERSRALSLFLAQLALNALWSPVFFGLHAIFAGLAIIALLIAALAATIWQAAPADRVAALLLVPYLIWLCYAAALNGAIATLSA